LSYNRSPLESSKLTFRLDPHLNLPFFQAISAAEVAKHKSADDAWVIIEGNVYGKRLSDRRNGVDELTGSISLDVTEFLVRISHTLAPLERCREAEDTIVSMKRR